MMPGRITKRSMYVLLVSAMAAACAAGASAQGGAAEAAEPGAELSDRVRAAIQLVPADAAAAVVMPRLKGASDDLAALFEGMDRTKALIGGRPIDQARALLGITSGVDEGRALAIAWPGATGEAERSIGAAVFIVPVSDEAGFLEANFDRADDVAAAAGTGAREDAWVRHNGEAVFARVEREFAVISADAEAFEWYRFDAAGEDVDGGDAEDAIGAKKKLDSLAGFAAADRLNAADVIVLVDGAAGASWLHDVMAAADAGGAADEGSLLGALSRFAVAARIVQGGADEAERIAVAVNLDPLAVGVNAYASTRPGETLESLARSAVFVDDSREARSASLDRLPGGRFFLAGGADVAALGGGEAIANALEDAFGDDLALPMAGISAVQFIALPPAAGPAAGMLNEMSIFIACDGAPAAVHDRIRDFVMSKAREDKVMRIAPAWTGDARTIGGRSVAAYELGVVFRAGRPEQSVLWSMLTGPKGLRGFVGEGEGGLIMTFSDRADVFERAVKAAAVKAGGAPGGAETLADSAMLRQMRGWMIAQPDVEVFMSSGEIATFLRTLFRQLGPMSPIDATSIPAIDAVVTPIGIAFDLREGVAEAAMLIPADAAAAIFDEIASRVKLLENDPDS